MRASLSTIRQFGGTEKDILDVGIDELVKLATNRLGGLEGYEEYSKRFEGIVVAKVVSCVPHDDSDHLHVCMLDDGGVIVGVERDEKGYVQVVCGAPNAREGLNVAWIPPNAVVPKSRDEAELFVLSSREIRGKVSNGMIASPAELGLYDNHDGILEIDVNEVGEELVKPGTRFATLYGLDDVLLDFENKMFTHRPDCFGQLGLARELAAIQGMTYTSPEWYWKKPQFKNADAQKISVFNDAQTVAPRIMAVAMSDVVVGESPVWLKSFITRMGGKPVNNVVDISNYIMHITGQPTHAYDLKKLDSATIGARMAKEGEKITLLNGKTAMLTSEDLVIADKKGPIGIAGIMGGNDTEVEQSTTDILLEVASFDMYSIRRSAMRHGLFTDAFTRFSKGQSPLQNDRVTAKFMEMLTELTGATQSSDVLDSTSEVTEQMLDQHAVHDLVKTSVEFVNSRLGTTLSFDEIRTILKSVEMAVIPSDDNSFEVGAPYWRTDIELPEDVVEEVGRLYGFDRLELKLPKRSTRPAPKNMMNEFKTSLRNSLASAGANEVLSYSFIHGDVLQKVGIAEPDKWCYHLRNAISPDLQYYRPSITPSLLSKVQQNLRSDMVRGDNNEFALFELGKAHVKGHEDDEKLPAEMERLALVFAADDKTAGRHYHGSAYYTARKYLSLIAGDSFDLVPLDTNDYPITAPYEIGRSATVSIGGQVLGVVGEYRQSVKRALKLPEYCAGFEVDIELLRKHISQNVYESIATYPKTMQDITLSVSKDHTYQEVETCIHEQLVEEQQEHGYVCVQKPRDIFETDDAIRYTFRLWVWHPHKTLTTEESNALIDRLAAHAEQTLKAERI